MLRPRKPLLPMRSLRIEQVSGVNWNDPSETIINRAFRLIQGGFQQIAPMEWRSGLNLDFSRQSLRKRSGSTLYSTLVPLLAGGETLLRGTQFSENVTTGSQYDEIVVSTKSIYVNRYTGTSPGTWAKLNSSAGIAYAHNATVARASFVSMDGHLFICIDGTNCVQVYRTGTALEDQLNGQYTAGTNTPASTTVNVDSNSGQKVLKVASTTTPTFQVGDRIRINSGGARDEAGYIASIQAGTSLTLVANLTNSHTAVQADAVIIENRYTQALGGTVSAITGTWNTGYYIGMSLQQRLCLSRGDVAIEYTGATNPWDKFNGGSIAADGPVIAMEAFTPRFANVLWAVGVIHTLSPNGALQYISGFDATDSISTIAGASPALNHATPVVTMNWVIYLTRNRRIEATNLQTVLDMGRRFHAADGASGPLDTLNISNALTSAFGFYDYRKRQAQFYFPDVTATTPTDAMVLDMQLGEPQGGDAQFADTGSYAYEMLIRNLYWELAGGDTAGGGVVNWFADIYQTINGVVGIMADGRLFYTETGTKDFDSLNIPFAVKSADFTMGLPSYQKKWRRMGVRSLVTLVGDMPVHIYLDRSASPLNSATWSWTQASANFTSLFLLGSSILGTGRLGNTTLGVGSVANGHSWLEVSAEALAFDISDVVAPIPQFILATIDLMYQPANLQD